MSRKLKSNPLLIAFITIFLDLLGFGIIIPVNPFFVQSLGAKPYVVTLIAASYSLMQFVFAPFWGRVSDRIGRRPVILISVFMSGLGHLIFSMAGSIPVIFGARMLAGFGNANLGTAQAIVSDSTTPEKRARGMGIIGAAFGLGFLFGPAIGGFLGQYGPQVPSFGAFILAMINLCLAYFLLPETRKAEGPKSERKIFSFEAIKMAMQQPALVKLLRISFIYAVAFALMEQVLGFLLEKYFVVSMNLPNAEHLRESAKLTAIVLTAVGITAVIIQGSLIGRLTKKFGEPNLLRFGLCAAGIAIVCYPLLAQTGEFHWVIMNSVLLACGTGCFNPSLMSLVSKNSNEGNRGEVLGLSHSLSSLGRVLGPSLSGWLFNIESGLPFFVSGALFLLGFATVVRSKVKLNPQT